MADKWNLSEKDLAIEAADEAFKAAVTQFTKDLALSPDDGIVRGGLGRVRRARQRMIALINEHST